MNEFEILTTDEMYYVEAGCGICKTGSTIAGASTGAGLIVALHPVGWAIAAGAVVGGLLGYLLAC